MRIVPRDTEVLTFFSQGYVIDLDYTPVEEPVIMVGEEVHAQFLEIVRRTVQARADEIARNIQLNNAVLSKLSRQNKV